jgi:hypothetical protein
MDGLFLDSINHQIISANEASCFNQPSNLATGALQQFLPEIPSLSAGIASEPLKSDSKMEHRFVILICPIV